MQKRTLLAGLGLVLVIHAAAPAQPASRPAARPASRPGGERPGMFMLDQARRVLDELKLTDDQKSKIDAIFDQAREKTDDLRRQLEGLEPRERMAKIQAFIKSIHDQVAALLDDKQRDEMDRKLDELHRNMGNRAGGNGPTTAPAGARTPGSGGAGMLERLRESLYKLDLNADQKAKIKDVYSEVLAKGQQLKQEAQNGSQEAREKLRDLVTETRDKLNEVLTSEQADKLRNLMRGDGPPPASRPAKPKKPDEQSMTDEKMSGESMAGDMKGDMKGDPKNDMAGDMKGDGMAGNARQRAGNQARRNEAAQETPKGVKVGEAAPALSLKRVDGALVQLSSLKGRVVVLEFGSYTSPAFRERAPAMEKLKNDYGTRAQFFVVYQREAHAKGEWEVARNKDAEISIEQPRTGDARIDLARKARQDLKMTVPILVDGLGNDAAIAYGAGENSAFVINRDGTIAARQEWFDPSGLRREIDEAVKDAPVSKAVE